MTDSPTPPDPSTAVRRALHGFELWLESDLGFGIETLPGLPPFSKWPAARARGGSPPRVAPAASPPQREAPRAAAQPSSTPTAVPPGQAAPPVPAAPARVPTSHGPGTPKTPPPREAPPPPAPAIARNVRKDRPPENVNVPVPRLTQQLGSPEKLAALAALASEVYACDLCRLSEGRTYGVPGEGNADADLMFIGEAPGADEDRSGRPFVGAAGELLTKIIHAMGFSRETVFICNIVKCQPPGNRVPNPDEIGSCFPYLRRQIEIVKPKVICTLGAPASRTILAVTSGIKMLRGKVMSFAGIPVVPTFHPAYLLRTPEDKPLVWKDVQSVARLVVEKGGTIPFPERLPSG